MHVVKTPFKIVPSVKNTGKEPRKLPSFSRIMPWLLLIGGFVGLVCAFIITVEKIDLLKNPQYVPPCNLNPVISCGSVMASKQAAAFGFPNPIIGLVAFSILITLGVVLLAGSTLKRWLWWGLGAGSLFGVCFVHWLFFQSVYRIHALCPYCMVVWVVTITTFWYNTLYILELSQNKLSAGWQECASFLRHHHLDILIFWLLAIAALILKHFWYYYGKHLF